MRQILLGDLIAAARALLELPRAERKHAVGKMLDRAHAADKVTKRTGQPHRFWGNGSLMAASFPKPKSEEPFLGDVEYLDALRETVEQVIKWKRRKHGSHHRDKD